MTPELMDEAVVCLMIFSGFMFLLVIAGVFADYILPHIPFVQRWLDSFLSDEDFDENEEDN